MINTMADQENLPNTQQLNNNRMDGKAANSVSNLRDKEGQPELRGFDLRALDTQDSEGIKWKQ